MATMSNSCARIHVGVFACALFLAGSGCVSHMPSAQADASRSLGNPPAVSATSQPAQDCVTMSESPGREILSDGVEIEPGWFLAPSRCGRFSVELPTRIFADGRVDGLDVVGTQDEHGVKYMALCGSVTRFDSDKRTLAAVRQGLVEEMQLLTEIDIPVKGGEGFEVTVIHNGHKGAIRAVQSQGHRCVLMVEPTRSTSYSETAARRFLNSLQAVGKPDVIGNLR